MTTQIANAPVASYQEDYDAIMGLLNAYFQGLYEGNVDLLRSVFHDDAWLKANDYRKTRDEWLEAVADRPVPSVEGMQYNFNIQSLEIVGDQAMAKVDVPLLAAHFIDFLGLLKEDGEWKIVNKMFTIV
ncbi:MAG: nuclear transport factor 2 family protein [Pseudomonadota bacterium]